MSSLPRWREMNQRQSLRSWIPWAIFTVAFLMFNCVAHESVTFIQAEEMFQQRRYSEAAAAFERIERTSPGKSDALLFLGKSFINLGRFAEAGTALDSYCAKHPQSDDALYLLAYVRFRENKPAESLRLFTQAARLKPPVADDFKIIGLDYALLDDNQSAARYLKRAVAMQPNNVEARYYLGRALYLENQVDECISVFEEVLKQDPTSVKAQDNLGLAWEGKNQPDKGMASYRKAIDMDKKSLKRSEQPYLNLGALLTKSGKPDEAIPFLQEAKQIRPESAKVRYELGNAYMAVAKVQDAKRELEESERLDPKDTATHYLLGRLYRRMGQTDSAARELRLTEELLDAKRKSTQTSEAR